MKSFKLARIEVCDIDSYQKRIAVMCTDPTTMDWILAELKKGFPQCKTSYEEYDPNGKLTRCQVAKFGGKDPIAAWGIITLLCDSGWEPFSLTDQY
ncbi:MAG: hypothetical protein Q7U34_05305 [Anaerolineales bacterium]|nr:hypothetical protein [Anaerolineales bacterium]